MGGPTRASSDMRQILSASAGVRPSQTATESQVRSSGWRFCRYSFSLWSRTETGPFTVERRIMAGPTPYSIRRLLSSQVLRALSQMLAWQLIGAKFRDSTTKPDWYPFGTIKVSGPFCASADSPVPLHVFPVSETEIGPFSVWTRTSPLLSSTLIGPFTALMSASPEKFFRLIGPL